jgi:hypothetical protein
LSATVARPGDPGSAVFLQRSRLSAINQYQEIDETSTVSYTVNSDGTVTLVQNGVPVVQLIIINANRFVMLNNITGVYPYVLIGQQ